MSRTVRSTWTLHRTLWRDAIVSVWERRHLLVLMTLALWVPWRALVPVLDRWLDAQTRLGIPLAWIADVFVEPFYAGMVLVVLSEERPPRRTHTLLRGMWLLPRLLLIDIKIAVWGVAAPYLVLHLGVAGVLTAWPTSAAARGVIAATVVSTGWMLVVLVRYLLAQAVLVAECGAEGWSLREGRVRGTMSRWCRGVSTGWALWAARRLIRGRAFDACLVMLLGQGAVLLVRAFVPPGDYLLAHVIDGATMAVALVWWGLLWQFLRVCINDTVRTD